MTIISMESGLLHYTTVTVFIFVGTKVHSFAVLTYSRVLKFAVLCFPIIS